MKLRHLLAGAAILLLSNCASSGKDGYVKGTIDEYYRLHWKPLVREMEKEPNQKRYQRKTRQPVKCSRYVLNTLPEECVEQQRRSKKRKRRSRR